ncbi:bacteriophage Gp15 family protein [Anaerotignum sp. MB30-C6]|uniref:bacteriophage Gp15 family protein n=1 Tax=Anaerotignum sp. MB30-C6 TaxID=3070814 RepID=UPI0027DC88FC|nr:bacteriophage Gp15 family protein [Anaerotignum sp. MB30-C6]WMI81847.1 bacteriophage Gp15 family protein [Anaerotignum sp. MB30-C6]
MSLLLDPLPKNLYINGKEYAIRWDHRTAILYETMMLDEEVEGAEKPLLALRLFYPIIPTDWAEALEGIQWFYRCGIVDDVSVKGKKKGKGKQDRIYSFEHDDSYIYSAFLEQYGLDLTEVQGLHWWRFRALFQGLSEDSALCKIMGYRGMDIPESMGKEQKEFYRKMKEQYRVPLAKGEQEKMNAIEQALLSGGDLTGLL